MIRLRPTIYTSRLIATAVFASFVLYYGLCCFRAEWAGDFQMYCAGVAQLYRDFAHPAHEAMNVSGSESTVYTPYLVLVAAIGRLLGLSPHRVLQLAGLANLVLYVVALRYFVSRYSIHRRTGLAAACFLLVILFVRWDHFGWSSEMSVLTMQFVQAYPSTVAWALAFFAFGLVEDFHRAGRKRLLFGLGAIICLLLLVHPITASWVIGIVCLRALWELARERDWRFPLWLVAGMVGGLAVAALWPYSAFLGQTAMTEVREPSKFGRFPLSDFLNLYLVAVPCALWILFRLRRHRFLALAFLATFAALELWRVLGISFGNRYSFFMAFWAQFFVSETAAAAGLLAIPGALGESNVPLAAERRHAWIDRPLALLLLAMAALSWLPSPMWQVAHTKKGPRLASPAELWRRPSRHDVYYGQFGGLVAHVGPGDLVIMPASRSTFDLASITGARVVSSPNAHGVPDAHARLRDMGRFFSAKASPGERQTIVGRYCATKVLASRKQFPLLQTLERWLGPPLYRDQNYVLFGTERHRWATCTNTNQPTRR